MLKTWQSRLATLQARSLRLWQEMAVRRAIETLRKGTDKSVASRDDSSQTSALPTGPSTYLLQPLNSLLHSLHALPLHRLHANPSPATSLLEAFSKEALIVAGEFLELLRGMEGGEEIKRQLVWDVTLIGMIIGESEDREKWEMTTTKFQQLVSECFFRSLLYNTDLGMRLLHSYRLPKLQLEKTSPFRRRLTSFEHNLSILPSSLLHLLYPSQLQSIPNFIVRHLACSLLVHLQQQVKESSRVSSESSSPDRD